MPRLTFAAPSILVDSGTRPTMQALQVLTPRQARAARAVLKLSVRELVDVCNVSSASIRRIEDGVEGVSLDLKMKLQRYYETQGLEFIIDGVRWENAQPEWPMVTG